MSELYKMEQLQTLVREGVIDFSPWGDVRTVVKGELILFNYTEHAQYEGRWNWLERVSRGLILNRQTGEVVARPFDKFFNFSEDPNWGTHGKLIEATEKVDGSLGITYHHEGQWKIATRGSFDSEQAVWATRYLNDYFAMDELRDDYTYLFEIVYPGNRIVVDYKGVEGLFLIGVRHRETGEDFTYGALEIVSDAIGSGICKSYSFDNPLEALALATKLDANFEGWVLRFADGTRYKVKGDAYKLAHKLMTQVSFKGVLEAVSTGNFERLIEGVPDEFLGTVKTYKAEIDVMTVGIKANVDYYMSRAPQADRKTFALWVRDTCPYYSAYMFAALDDRDIVPLIYKNAFRNRKDETDEQLQQL